MDNVFKFQSEFRIPICSQYGPHTDHQPVGGNDLKTLFAHVYATLGE